MAFEREGRAPELIRVMKQPRPDQLVLEENEGLFRRRGVWLLTGKVHFFGMGNSDAGLVTPPPARLQQGVHCRVLPRLCLRPLSSHPRSSRRFGKTTNTNQLLLSHCGRALGSMGCSIRVTDLGIASEAPAEPPNYPVEAAPSLAAPCQERRASTSDKSPTSVPQ